jgi:hypothetical protein
MNLLLCIFFWDGVLLLVQAGLELEILLSQPPNAGIRLVPSFPTINQDLLLDTFFFNYIVIFDLLHFHLNFRLNWDTYLKISYWINREIGRELIFFTYWIFQSVNISIYITSLLLSWWCFVNFFCIEVLLIFC